MSGLKIFINQINKIYSSGSATEASYRIELSKLIEGYGKTISVINEPKRIECGAPDLVIRQNKLTVGYLEQKDISVDLRNFSAENEKQQIRYLDALPNLIYTNCLDWEFYRDGKIIKSVKVAELKSDKIRAIPDKFPELDFQLQEFLQNQPQPISNPRELAVRMADKTNLLKDIIFNTLKSDESEGSELRAQFELVKEKLIHDITIEEFADIYAETVAYGLLTARLYANDQKKFNRQSIGELLPKSNPFLRGLFSIISGEDLGVTISWIIEDLVEIIRICDISKFGFEKIADGDDPFLHFYESFLSQYNPEKRDAKGVWYTPDSIVKFIVRAVDSVLKSEFGLYTGIADSSKVPPDPESSYEDELHRVQILDPATGTGTFLAETIRQIERNVKKTTPSNWNEKYIIESLIPRIHGFELLMAPYAMCHVKLGMILKEFGLDLKKNTKRLSIFLTNAIEKGEVIEETLGFANWLSKESQGANEIKREPQIMCVIGNPPYNENPVTIDSSESSEEWMEKLMKDYKTEPNSNIKLQDSSKAMNNLYVKFIRMASDLIKRNKEGVLAFVTNHGYMENMVFRGMRWHMLQLFDKIWVLDLHGNSIRKETSPDGSPDQNVFDIRMGVAIIIAVKTKDSNSDEAKIWRGDLWGTRDSKYDKLNQESIYGELFEEIHPQAPDYFFEKINFENFEEYESGFCLSEIFKVKSDGIVTSKDKFATDKEYKNLSNRLKKLLSMGAEEARLEFELGKDTHDWKVQLAQMDIGEFDQSKMVKMCHRPFDSRWIYYTGFKGVISTPRYNVMQHLLCKDNIALLCCRQQGKVGFQHAFVTDRIASKIAVSNLSREGCKVFPLFTLENNFEKTEKISNLDAEIVEKFKVLATDQENGAPDELAIFDYVYGVLHCPDYRTTYAEYLRKDFPKIRFPNCSEEFWDISSKGTHLRKLHLMEDKVIGEIPCRLSEGTNEIVKVKFGDNKIWINEHQCFENVPEVSWKFKIGGYKPAEKWLNDRKGTILDAESTLHYYRILKVLSETDRIMKTITMKISS